MAGLTLTVQLQNIQELEAEAVAVGFFEDVRPLRGLAGGIDWMLCGALSKLISRHGLKGAIGDVGLLTSQGKMPARKIFMTGYGSRRSVSEHSLQQAARAATETLIQAGVTEAAIEYIPLTGMPVEAGAAAVYRGITEGADNASVRIVVLAPDAVFYEKMLHVLKDFEVRSGRVHV